MVLPKHMVSQRKALKAAREAIAMGRAKQIQRHFVSLPTEEAHTCHPVGQAAKFLPTDPSDHPPKNIGISFIRYRGNQGSPKSIKSLCQTHPPK